MMEEWNFGILGMKSGIRAILQEMSNLLFLMLLARQLFSGFSAKIIHQNKKINEIICVLNIGLFKPIIPIFQHSITPIVSEAN
jgi:predicted lactoylglutathione lyase